jgi:hypothetical protein
MGDIFESGAEEQVTVRSVPASHAESDHARVKLE